MKQKLLIIDDESSIIESLTRALHGLGCEILSSSDPKAALDILRNDIPQVVITDLKMPNLDGLQVLRFVKEFHPHIQVIVMTGHGSIDDAVSSMKMGAYDFIPKPFNKQEIVAVVHRAFEKVSLLEENFSLREKLKQSQQPAFEVGKSRIYRELLGRASQAAASDATILISGDAGTGKEVLAQHIVAHSHRDHKPYVSLNCAAIPEALMEAELFGYEKGAFPGANQGKKGKFLDADGGTLFLDEISELPMSMQTKVLRVLQDGEISLMGGDTKKVDIRLIAATHKNLRKRVEAGFFREDLFYRLNVIPLMIPALRQRPEDLHSLISFFIAKYCKKNKKANLSVSADALKLMERYNWPGNVRELENAIERAVILCTGHQIGVGDLPDELSGDSESGSQLFVGRGMTMEEIELSVIHNALKRNHGDKQKTAEELGISLRTVYRKLDAITQLENSGKTHALA